MTQTSTDKEIAERLRSKAGELNEALTEEAARAGLNVEIHESDITTFGEAARCRMLTLEIERREPV